MHLLGVERILIVPHTKCAMAKYSENKVRELITESAGVDASWHSFGVTTDQEAGLREDVKKVTTHPLIPGTVKVGGFLYDVDTGLMTQLV